MNPNLAHLHPYPFEKLRNLLQGADTSPLTPLAFSIGEPQHPAPQRVLDELAAQIGGVNKYPSTKGIPELRHAISDWVAQRFGATLDADSQVLPVNGTREALFAFAQAMIDPTSSPLVVMPNPFYQIYEGAALLAGGTPHYLPCDASHGLKPDFDAVPADVWERCQLLYICSPGNPTGAVIDAAQLKRLITLADKHDFIIASDECYSEIYTDAAPIGLLEACAQLGRDDFARCVVFHSLSKRSNLPGLRSGFVAGDARLLESFLRYRTYHGCAMSNPHQLASIAAWRDESHVEANRALYRDKFKAVLDILQPVMAVAAPDAGFYLWPQTPIDDQVFVRELKRSQNLTLLPGSLLSRELDGVNPGASRVRMALVAPLDDCIEGAQRMRRFIEAL